MGCDFRLAEAERPAAGRFQFEVLVYKYEPSGGGEQLQRDEQQPDAPRARNLKLNRQTGEPSERQAAPSAGGRRHLEARLSSSPLEEPLFALANLRPATKYALEIFPLELGSASGPPAGQPPALVKLSTGPGDRAPGAAGALGAPSIGRVAEPHRSELLAAAALTSSRGANRGLLRAALPAEQAAASWWTTLSSSLQWSGLGRRGQLQPAGLRPSLVLPGLALLLLLLLLSLAGLLLVGRRLAASSGPRSRRRAKLAAELRAAAKVRPARLAHSDPLGGSPPPSPPPTSLRQQSGHLSEEADERARRQKRLKRAEQIDEFKPAGSRRASSIGAAPPELGCDELAATTTTRERELAKAGLAADMALTTSLMMMPPAAGSLRASQRLGLGRPDNNWAGGELGRSASVLLGAPASQAEQSSICSTVGSHQRQQQQQTFNCALLGATGSSSLRPNGGGGLQAAAAFGTMRLVQRRPQQQQHQHAAANHNDQPPAALAYADALLASQLEQQQQQLTTRSRSSLCFGAAPQPRLTLPGGSAGAAGPQLHSAEQALQAGQLISDANFVFACEQAPGRPRQEQREQAGATLLEPLLAAVGHLSGGAPTQLLELELEPEQQPSGCRCAGLVSPPSFNSCLTDASTTTTTNNNNNNANEHLGAKRRAPTATTYSNNRSRLHHSSVMSSTATNTTMTSDESNSDFMLQQSHAIGGGLAAGRCLDELEVSAELRPLDFIELLPSGTLGQQQQQQQQQEQLVGPFGHKLLLAEPSCQQHSGSLTFADGTILANHHQQQQQQLLIDSPSLRDQIVSSSSPAMSLSSSPRLQNPDERAHACMVAGSNCSTDNGASSSTPTSAEAQLNLGLPSGRRAKARARVQQAAGDEAKRPAGILKNSNLFNGSSQATRSSAAKMLAKQSHGLDQSPSNCTQDSASTNL